jgi:hypothetical protein
MMWQCGWVDKYMKNIYKQESCQRGMLLVWKLDAAGKLLLKEHRPMATGAPEDIAWCEPHVTPTLRRLSQRS